MGKDEEIAAAAVERVVFVVEAAVTSSLSYVRRVLFLLSVPEEGGQERVSNCTFLAVREVEERVRPLELELRDLDELPFLACFLQFVSISLPFRGGRRKEKREE